MPLAACCAGASDSEEQLQLAEDERQESGVVGSPDEEEAMSSEAEDVSDGSNDSWAQGSGTAACGCPEPDA